MSHLHIVDKYNEDLDLYCHLAHEAAEGRYSFSLYELSVIEAALQELLDIKKSEKK